MIRDIENRDDVVTLVDTFYGKVMISGVIGFIFSDVAAVDWGKHLPNMYNFWNSLLFGEREYSGNPMRIHVALSKMTEMSKEQFNEWLHLFNETVDELFIGEKANEAKSRALKIATLMQTKIRMSNQSSFIFNPNSQ